MFIFIEIYCFGSKWLSFVSAMQLSKIYKLLLGSASVYFTKYNGCL